MEIPSLSVTPSGTPIWTERRGAGCAVLKDKSRKQPPPNRTYPLRGVLRCDECGKFLTATPTKNRRFYGCRKDQLSGCGHVVVTADIIEHHVFGLVLPIAVSTALRYKPWSSSKPRPVQSAAARF
jgi:hypothetical protein